MPFAIVYRTSRRFIAGQSFLDSTVEIVHTDDVLGGKPRIEGHRISVRQVAVMVREADYTPDDVAEQLGLTIAEVYVALAYYFDNPEEMQAIEERREEIIEELRKDAITGPDDV